MKKIIYILTVIALSFTFNSCESETSILDVADDIGFTGTTEDVQNFLGADNLQTILNLGIPVYYGDNPPIVDGSYLVSPLVLHNTNIEGDFEIGHEFNSTQINFSLQDNNDLSINYSTNQEIGLQSFISGTGDDFTVFIKVSSTLTGDSGNTVNLIKGIAISGSISSSGITNYENAFVIISKTGDTNNDFINLGDGRSVIDEDGLAVRL